MSILLSVLSFLSSPQEDTLCKNYYHFTQSCHFTYAINSYWELNLSDQKTFTLWIISSDSRDYLSKPDLNKSNKDPYKPKIVYGTWEQHGDTLSIQETTFGNSADHRPVKLNFFILSNSLQKMSVEAASGFPPIMSATKQW